MPYDLFTPEFYTKRKNMIEKRLQEFNSTKLFGLRKITFENELRSAYHRYFGKPCRPIENWQRYSVDELTLATKFLEKDQLSFIMKRLLENFNDNRRGIPDLFLIDPLGRPLFIEVKAEKEKVAEHQLSWQQFLKNQIKVDVSICRVISN